MTWFIPGWLKRAVAGLVAGAALLLGAWVAGRREGRQKADTDALKDNLNTRKRMDEADIVGDDPDAARRWLHERTKR